MTKTVALSRQHALALLFGAVALVVAVAIFFLFVGYEEQRLVGLVFGVMLGGCAVWIATARARVGSACSFCKKTRAQVARLVAGDVAAICDECVGTCIEVLASESAGGDRLKGLREAVAAMYRVPGARLSRSDSALVAQVSLLLDGESPEVLRRMVSSMLGFENPQMALSLDARLPSAERTVVDEINRAVALYLAGRPADALAALAPLDPAALDVVQRGLVFLNRAAFLSDLPALDRQRISEGRAMAEAARRAFEEMPFGGPGQHSFETREHYLAQTLETLARYARHDGRFDEVLRLLGEARERAQPSASRLVLEARAWAALGNEEKARSAARRALEIAHPESREYREALELAPAARDPAAGPYSPPSF